MSKNGVYILVAYKALYSVVVPKIIVYPSQNENKVINFSTVRGHDSIFSQELHIIKSDISQNSI